LRNDYQSHQGNNQLVNNTMQNISKVHGIPSSNPKPLLTQTHLRQKLIDLIIVKDDYTLTDIITQSVRVALVQLHDQMKCQKCS